MRNETKVLSWTHWLVIVFFFLQQVCFYPILQQLLNDVWYCSVESKPLLVQFILTVAKCFLFYSTVERFHFHLCLITMEALCVINGRPLHRKTIGMDEVLTQVLAGFNNFNISGAW